ncbi:MAG: acyltransferase family protein [Pseudomonadota bacterium]
MTSVAFPQSKVWAHTRTTMARDGTLDIARGIAIALVVFGHALDGAQSAGFESRVLRFLMLSVYAVHVPLFLLVSGILSARYMAKSTQDFWAELWTRLIWSYLLWSFILLSVHHAMAAYTNTIPKNYHPVSILWHAPAVMWFLYVLIFCLILLRCLRRAPRVFILGLGLICLLAPYISADIPQKLRFIGMFLIGAGSGPGVLDHIRQPLFVLAAAVLMAASLSHAAVLSASPIFGYPAQQLTFLPAAFAGPILIYTIARRLPPGILHSVLRHLGQHTLAIFVAHILATAGLRIMLTSFGIADWWLIISLATIAGVALPFVAGLVAKRWGISALIGWG